MSMSQGLLLGLVMELPPVQYYLGYLLGLTLAWSNLPLLLLPFLLSELFELVHLPVDRLLLMTLLRTLLLMLQKLLPVSPLRAGVTTVTVDVAVSAVVASVIGAVLATAVGTDTVGILCHGTLPDCATVGASTAAVADFVCG
jgi:hypothetical protein